MSADHKARLQAQQELVRPLVIEAGAGTGKTATLVARILSWTLGPGWEKAAASAASEPRTAAAVLSGVVAITFTEAAATEMAERVSAGLAEIESGRRPVGFTAPDAPGRLATLDGATVRRRAAALLSAVDQLHVRTIHAFCRKLLAEHPFEAGVHPAFTIDPDGTVLREVVEESVQSRLPRAYGEPGDDDYLLLAGRGQGPMEIADAVYDLAVAGWTSATFDADPLATERRGELLERLWQVSNQLLTVLETRRVTGSRARNAAALVGGLGRLRRHLRRARRQGVSAGGVEVTALQAWLDEALPDGLSDHLRLWARGETANQSEKERLASARQQLMPLAEDLYRLRRHVARLDPELLASSRRVLGPLLAQVQDVMRSRGVLGFADLLREARNLVSSRPRLLARLRRRIDQLLVDEFQDTDPLQCELIRRLALEGPEEERPGLFVVGDPKQSIYGWRSADLAAYEGFVDAVLAAGGELLALDENFRSTPVVLEEVERVIAPVMLRSPGLQPEFRPLVPGRGSPLIPALSPKGERENPVAAMEYWVSWVADPKDPALPAEGKARETSELEARALAADLLELHASGVAWSEVGVLLRSLTDLETYLSALREARVPFVVSRDRQYYRRREIIDAAALVRTVLAPEDHLALLTFLRTVVVAVPDAALIPLWSGGLPEMLSELARPDTEKLEAVRQLACRVGRGLPAEVPGIERVRGWEHNLAYAAWCLAELRRSFEDDPVDVFVGALRRSTLFEASESARYLGVFRHANLERFFNELLVDLEQEESHRHRVLRRLRARIAGGFDAEEARPAEASDDAVQVLTIHKAKGLEFRHVYLLQTHKEAGRRGVSSLEVGEVDRRTEYRIFGAATLGFDQLEARRGEVARAELVRTLYVAMTRAAERLVVVGRRPLSGSGALLERAATHMDLLLRRRGEAPSTAELVELWGSGAPEVGRDVVWRLPGRLVTEPEAAEGSAEMDFVPVGEIRSRRDRLRQDRVAALARMRRPVRQVASKIGGERTEVAFVAEPEEAAFEAESTSILPPAEDPVSQRRRRAAMASGSAVHRVLELFDHGADPEEELARCRAALPELIEVYASGEEAAEALSRARRLLDGLAGGRLFQRFLEIGDRIVAREMPVLLPPAEGDEALGYVAGVIDLVYRDPASGEVVIADFKTDHVASPEVAREHAGRYAAQGKVYSRALEEMLELSERPRFELWYLFADCLVSG